MTSIDYTAAAERYIAAWNAGDPAERRGAVAAAFADGATYADSLMSGTGHNGIDGMIGVAQGQFPGFAFRLRLRPGVDGFGDRVRFAWDLGPTEMDETIVGWTAVCRNTIGVDRFPRPCRITTWSSFGSQNHLSSFIL